MFDKYRIVKVVDGRMTHFEVKRRRCFIWFTLKYHIDSEGHKMPYTYSTLSDAQEKVELLIHPQLSTKEVVFSCNSKGGVTLFKSQPQ